jgi:hypothetical protein
MAGEQDRSRTDPFAGQPPDTARDYGRAPSDLSTAAQAERVRPLDGQQARYRLAFVAMEVPGLPPVVKIGPVEITQQAGPIWTQHTYIRQRPGWRPHYDKTMHQGYLQVGEGLQLTLAELPVVVPQSQHIQGALARWRDQVLAAVSMLAALLDERVAQRELLEDLIVYDSTGSRPWASVDTEVRVRDFLPRRCAGPAILDSSGSGVRAAGGVSCSRVVTSRARHGLGGVPSATRVAGRSQQLLCLARSLAVTAGGQSVVDPTECRG